MGHSWKRLHLLLLYGAAVLAVTASACSSADPDIPPRALPEKGSIQQAIGWLTERGVTVKTLPDPELKLPRYGSNEIQRVSLNGHEDSWIIAYEQPPTPDELVVTFSLYADFVARFYPTVLVAGGNVVLMRGVQQDVIDAVTIALWDLSPSITAAPFGAGDRDGFRSDSSQRMAKQWLVQNRSLSANSLQSPVLTKFQTVSSNYELKPVVSNAPHPGSHVWVTEFANANSTEFRLLVSEMISGLVIAESVSDQRFDLSSIDQMPLPAISQFSVAPSADEAQQRPRALVTWEHPDPIVHVPDYLHESIQTYVIERKTSSSANWEPIVWTDSQGHDRRLPRPQQLIPLNSDGEIDPDMLKALLSPRYTDFAVQQNEVHEYRVFGCTDLGRKTGHSTVASVKFGDFSPAVEDQPPDGTEPIDFTDICQRNPYG